MMKPSVSGAAGLSELPGASAASSVPGSRARRHRIGRTAGAALAALTVALVTGGVLAMLVTPSVSNAMAIARSVDRQHHVAFPGPPVPARFARALIATEDHRFAYEPGVDPIAIARVLLGRLTGHGNQGGATLYQQLAKLLYTPGQSGIAVEIEQVLLGVKLKFSYSGSQILRMYSDVVYFGHGFWGIQAASCGYFGVQPGRLSWPQAALLAGLVQAPSLYDPLRYPSYARLREEHVLGRLVATNVLTPRQAQAVLAVPIRMLVAGRGGCRG